jgi:hypothetical protein
MTFDPVPYSLDSIKSLTPSISLSVTCSKLSLLLIFSQFEFSKKISKYTC